MSTGIEPAKPLPAPDEASAPFFEGLRRGELLLQRCGGCGGWMWPVKPRCVTCFSPDLRWEASSGRGTLYTFGLMHQLYDPAWAEEIPYAIAVVELEEGVRMTANVRGIANDELEIGMPLEVCFEEVAEDLTVPRVRPAGS